jgi:hypothetical protein
VIAARSEAEQLRTANAELQRRLQDDEAAMKSLQSVNASSTTTEPSATSLSSSPKLLAARREVRVITRNKIVEMLMAASRKSHLCGRFDVRAIVEGFADQLVLINDEHCKHVAMLKAEFDATCWNPAFAPLLEL